MLLYMQVNKKNIYTCSMVPDIQSIREYQNFPNSYLLFTKVSMHLSISHSLCSTVFSLCRCSSRSPIMLSILLVMYCIQLAVYYYYIYMYSQLHVGHTNTYSCERIPGRKHRSPDPSSGYITKRLQNRRTGLPIQPHIVCVALLQCDMHACSTVCHFAHARPTMRSILLVINPRARMRSEGLL